MTTAPSSSSRVSPSRPPTSGPDRFQRETLHFLSLELVPSLRRAGRRTLVTAVERAVERADIGLLAELPDRARRDLLDFLEDHLPTGGGTSRAIVSLTSVVAPLPSPVAGRVGRPAGPAR